MYARHDAAVVLRFVSTAEGALTLALLVHDHPVSVRVERPDVPTVWQRSRSFALLLGEGGAPG